MSNRLTFSLASLVLIFALTFSAAFVDEAQANADFEGKTISDMVFTEDIDVGTITLPTAKNADSYTLTGLPSGLSFDATARTITGDADDSSGRSIYTYTAVDDNANNATLTFTIEVKANKAPKFATDAEIKDLVLKIGIDAEPLVDFPTATDPDAGDELTYSLVGILPDGVQFDPFQQRFVGRPTAETGSVAYTYTATDRADNTATLTFNITAVEANAKPTFGTGATRKSIANMTLKVDEAIKDAFLPPATDANTGDELTYTLPGTLPTGLEYIESARLLRGTPTDVKAETEYTYTVTDPDGNTDELKFKITVRADPVFAESASIRDYTFVVGTEVDAGPFPTATDADDDIDAYSISPQPPDGVTFVASLRKLLGNPTATQEATEYTYTVTDEAGGTDELTFNITVADQAPADTTPPVLTPTVGTADPTTGAVTVTLAFDEALEAPPTVVASATPTGHDTTYTVSAVTGGTAANPNTYMVTVTPKMGTDLTADVPELTVTLTVSAMDTSDNALTTGNTVDVTLAARIAPADTTPPVLTSTVGTPDATTGAVTVTLGFDEALKAAPTVTSSGTPTGHDTTYTVSAVTGGTAADPNTYMVTVTPKMGTDLTADVPALKVTLTVSAMDTSDNALTTGNTVDVTLAERTAPVVVVDTTAPTVMITVESKDSNGKHMLPANGMVEFKLVFDEALAKAPSISRLQVSDFTIERYTSEPYFYNEFGLGWAGGIDLDNVTLSAAKAVDADADGTTDEEEYILTVPAGANPQIVTIDLDPRQVTDVAGNILGGIPESRWAKFDTIPPSVKITPVKSEWDPVKKMYIPTLDSRGKLQPMLEGPANTKVMFAFEFDERLSPTFSTDDIDRAGSDNVRLLDDSKPYDLNANISTYNEDPNYPYAYTVVVTPADSSKATTVLMLRNSVQDLAQNKLQADTTGTYTPKGDHLPPMISISGPTELSCEPGAATPPRNLIAITVQDVAPQGIPISGIATNSKVEASEVTISAGWEIKNFTQVGAGATFNLYPKTDGTAIGLTQVTVTIGNDAVADVAGNKSVAPAPSTFTVGPVLTIPAGEYITVIRPEHDPHGTPAGYSHLGDPLYVGSTGVRAPVIVPQTWDCMPDLTVFFGRKAPGIGGGALVVKVSPEHTGNTIVKGSVGISEIMWASDEGLPHGGTPDLGRSNLDQAREQWIELHNLNSFAVKVTLFARNGNDALTTENDEIDRASNFEIGSSWEVKGQSGNSQYGADFVSMQRGKGLKPDDHNAGEIPTAGKNYAHGDFNGKSDGAWHKSGLSYLTRQSKLAHTGQLPVDDLNYDFRGTPGRSNKLGIHKPPLATVVGRSPVIFNEIANRTNANRYYEWIELRNVTNADENLKGYRISYVTAKDKEFELYTFTGDTTISANSVLLLVDTDPEGKEDHPIAADNPKMKYKTTDFKGNGLPDDGMFVLILRKYKNDDRHAADLKSPAHIIDVAGYDDNLNDTAKYTKVWPLDVWQTAPYSKNKLAVEAVLHRRDPGRAGVYGENNNDKPSFAVAGYSGIGYKRLIPNIPAHGGTPGYDNGVAKVYEDDKVTVSSAPVTISEVMYHIGSSTRLLPQWIELYNSSKEEVVQVEDWTLQLENAGDDAVSIRTPRVSVKLKAKLIQPNQTILIVASTTGDNSDHFPDSRVIDIWGDGLKDKDRLEIDATNRRTFKILSETAFKITLKDKGGAVVDTAGNLGADWDLPEEGENRSSLIRRYDGKVARDGTLSAGGAGKAAWVLASSSDLYHTQDDTYYGNVNDEGSPGFRGGGPLPVSLSKFRPERLDDGSIVVRWITESELNNAGFNILRSETKDGEYTKLNTQLIAGQGTTSERTTYTYSDTSAKPNVVYYYQIQDVSLDGKVTTLRVNRLKGHISAAGKATTTWAELKALQ